MRGHRWAAAIPGAAARPSRGQVCGTATASLAAPRKSALHDLGRRQIPTDERGLPHPQCRHSRKPAAEPLPVMVFVHGGGYIMGSSATPLYDGAALARRGCVYVSVNYRLGALGCLDLSSLSTGPTSPSTATCTCAIWCWRCAGCRDNIAEFGGDPDNVTIFGESAGAHTIATLLTVPAAEGLFARAISESPAAAWCGRRRSPPSSRSDTPACLVPAPTTPPTRYCRRTPAQLVEAQHRLIDEGMREQVGRLPDWPRHRRRLPADGSRRGDASGRAHRLPLIVGTNADEGRLFTRFLRMLPTNKAMIEELLADAEPATRERITAAYPDYPASVGMHSARRRLRLQLGGLADCRGAQRPRTHLPLPVRLRPAGTALVRSGSHPCHRVACGVRFLSHQVRRVADRRGRPARRATCQQPGATAVAVVQPRRGAGSTTGPSTPPTIGPSWSSTESAASSSIRTRSGELRGMASHWRSDLAR